jgi:pimeloyl-ACP methyl ester carboxylesterase
VTGTTTRPVAATSVGRRAPAARAEQMRARYPDDSGFIERDGVRVFWERYGDGMPTILLLPTWSIFHSRHWKGQIPYLARHFRVVTFDGRGNGRSDRPTGPDAYTDTEFVADAVAVLDATGTERAVVAGLSMGAGYAVRLAVDHPGLVVGLVLIGASLPLFGGEEAADTASAADDGDDRHDAFEDPLPDDEGWSKYNVHSWRRDWLGFAEWWATEALFTEPHSTKPIEDAVGWMLETDPETIIASERAPFLEPPVDWGPPPSHEDRAIPFVDRVAGRPTLLIHGSDDRIIPIRVARRLATLLDTPLHEIAGGGHVPLGRDPVRVNLLIRAFVEAIRRDDP